MLTVAIPFSANIFSRYCLYLKRSNTIIDTTVISTSGRIHFNRHMKCVLKVFCTQKKEENIRKKRRRGNVRRRGALAKRFIVKRHQRANIFNYTPARKKLGDKRNCIQNIVSNIRHTKICAVK